MKRLMPPFPAVRAFEAAARLLSFKSAAEELCVSPSAVSHQIRTLEDFLGRRLFLRAKSNVALTPAGQLYMGQLTPIFDELDRSTRTVSRSGGRTTIDVLTTPAFATRWLIPRLDQFDAADISLHVSQGAPCTDFKRNNVDVVVHWGDLPIPGAVVEPLMRTGRYPVASPEYRDRHRIAKPSDLLTQRLIHDEVMDAWEEWFDLVGLIPPKLPLGPRLAHCDLTLAAAEQGQGVALAYDAMARSALRAGRLVRLFTSQTLPVITYSFACPERLARIPEIRRFRDFLFAEVAAEGFGLNHAEFAATPG